VSGRRAATALALAGALVAALAALPLAYLVIRSAGADADAWETLLRFRTLELVGRTLALVGTVTAAALGIGVTLAWLVVRTDLPARRLVAVAAALPLVIPSYVVALALIAAVGPGGLLGQGNWIFGFPGAWTALTLATYPYVYLLCAAALRRADPALEEAARALGRTRAQVFRQVTLPVMRPSASAAAVLVALYTLSDFGVVSLMRFDALTRAIFTQYRTLFDRTPAALLGLLLVVLTIGVLALEARGRGRGRVVRAGAGAARPATITPLGRWRAPAAAAVGCVLAAAFAMPVATLVGWALRPSAEAPGAGDLLAWATNSVLISAAAAVVAILAALPLATLVARRPGRLSRGLERATFASNALPGIVVALSLVFFATRTVTPLYQTLPLLVFAYVVRFLPQALSGARDALGRVSPELEQAARGLGAGPARTFQRVTFPLLLPGLYAGATLVFLSTMKELPATLLLRPIGYDTLATQVWSATGTSSYAAAAPPALALIALSAPVVYALQVHLEQRTVASADI